MRGLLRISVFVVLVAMIVISVCQAVTAASDDRQNFVQPLTAKKQILVLNSYHHGMEWVNEMEKGIRSVFNDPNQVNLYIDFMDTKRNVSSAYTQKMVELFREKYKNKKFDAIIVADEYAYQFVLCYQQELFPEMPIVFLGVNDYQELPTQKRAWVTGVVETTDCKTTIDLALKLHPGTREVVIINDKTSTGVANRQQLNMIMPEYKDQVRFTFLEDLSMSEVLERVSHLPSDSFILLLTFNQDKGNNAFEYDESLELIAGAANVPIYGVWDFYVSQGIVGGMVTSGYSQAEAAALLAKQTLQGIKPGAIPIITDSPNRYMFNYHQLKKFKIAEASLPPDSIVLHKPKSFYSEYKALVWTVAGIILSLLLVIAGLYFLMVERRKTADSLKLFATVDPMTGIFNRRAGLTYLKEMIMSNRPGTICFTDVNELKLVNDTYGHNEGDELIRTVAETFSKNLRKTDFVCRLGGDEFLLIFPGIDLDGAEKVWMRIAASFNQYNETKHKPYKVIVSHGMTHYDGKREITVDELVREADGAMYQEKNRYRETASSNETFAKHTS